MGRKPALPEKFVVAAGGRRASGRWGAGAGSFPPVPPALRTGASQAGLGSSPRSTWARTRRLPQASRGVSPPPQWGTSRGRCQEKPEGDEGPGGFAPGAPQSALLSVWEPRWNLRSSPSVVSSEGKQPSAASHASRTRAARGARDPSALFLVFQ